MLLSHLRDLIEHMEWADSVVWRSVRALEKAESDANIRERLHHVHLVQWTYLQMWMGESIDSREASSFADLEAIHAWVREYHRWAAGWADGLDAADLEREVEFPWAERLVERFGSARPATLAETIVQVVYHTTYHRGQINTRLRELGGEPPLTDFVGWIWMGRPDPVWEGGSD